jgi:hypothetical protein
MAWIVAYAVVCQKCGAVRVDPDARDEDQAIRCAFRVGWHDGLCPDCARPVIAEKMRDIPDGPYVTEMFPEVSRSPWIL